METFTGLRSQGEVPVAWKSSPENCLGIQFLLRDFDVVKFYNCSFYFIKLTTIKKQPSKEPSRKQPSKKQPSSKQSK